MQKSSSKNNLAKFYLVCEKYLLGIFTTIFVTFFLMMIIVPCLAYGESYVYKIDNEGTIYDFNVQLKDDKSYILTCNINGEAGFSNVDQENANESSYFIASEGILYSVTGDTISTVGEISAFKLKIDTRALRDAGATSDELEIFKDYDLNFTCNKNMNLFISAVAITCFFAILTAGCVIILVLDKKGKINTNITSNDNSSTKANKTTSASTLKTQTPTTTQSKVSVNNKPNTSLNNSSKPAQNLNKQPTKQTNLKVTKK